MSIKSSGRLKRHIANFCEIQQHEISLWSFTVNQSNMMSYNQMCGIVLLFGIFGFPVIDSQQNYSTTSPPWYPWFPEFTDGPVYYDGTTTLSYQPNEGRSILTSVSKTIFVPLSRVARAHSSPNLKPFTLCVCVGVCLNALWET